jgi:hypothetical protein
MKLFSTCALCAALALSVCSTSSAASASTDDKKAKQPPSKPCTIRSPSSGLFFDLNALSMQPPKDAKDKDAVESWHVKGYDYGSNFTLNFCAPVVEDIGVVEGVDEALWKNVSAFYTAGKKTYSIGYACDLTKLAEMRIANTQTQATKFRPRFPRFQTGPQLH